MMRYGKNTQMIVWFINQIRKGKRPLIMGPDYVVMRREQFDELIKLAYPPDFTTYKGNEVDPVQYNSIIFEDEPGEIDEAELLKLFKKKKKNDEKTID